MEDFTGSVLLCQPCFIVRLYYLPLSRRRWKILWFLSWHFSLLNWSRPWLILQLNGWGYKLWEPAWEGITDISNLQIRSIERDLLLFPIISCHGILVYTVDRNASSRAGRRATVHSGQSISAHSSWRRCNSPIWDHISYQPVSCRYRHRVVS